MANTSQMVIMVAALIQMIGMGAIVWYNLRSARQAERTQTSSSMTEKD